MKKILLAIALLIVSGVGVVFYMNTSEEATSDHNKGDLKEKIEAFAEDKIKVKNIEKEKSIDQTHKVVLFRVGNEKLGFAVLNGNNVIAVKSGEDIQGYEHYKNSFIVYGKKPKSEYSKLNLLIDTESNGDIKKTIDLDEGDYYLEVQSLSEDIEHSELLLENYIFQ
ncbi:hypothetical protein JFL43_13540 [Viridibacillus sp. YIM B01967]|uniref:Uncharacterized protein n=1 Tax=Viridibacillus soli TaxID=2798301 RepID=A0ABS1H8W4_9BACL|nr:hypothetical protein [Viridibacillus soli]MBK3495862.1 hypothetical protein [Viridibacillus soli]